MAVIRITLDVKPDTEDQSGVSIKLDALHDAGILTDERTSFEAFLRGIFEMAIDGLREQRRLPMAKKILEEDRVKEEADRPLRSEAECLGCRFDSKDERVYRAGAEVIRCPVCKKWCQPFYDVAGNVLSPIAP